MLTVWHNKKLVGKLYPAERGNVAFQYAASWLANAGSMPISLSLPLMDEAFSTDLSTAFFDNLLPEECLREAVARERGLESSATYALLEVLGAECAGAFVILPAHETPSDPPHSYTPLSQEALTRYIAQLPTQPLLGGQKEMRLSLAGAQSKGVVRIDAQMAFSLPQNGAPSTHIIKPASIRYPNLPGNEIFCMGLATHMRLEVPPFFLTSTLPQAFVVERYDRRIVDGSIERLHQEDFCQALGLARSRKYQRGAGTATLPQCFALLSHCQNPAGDVHKLLQWVIFNVCIGNSDAHAKNISLLYDGKKPRLAPFYDLVSTAPYDVSQKMALKIGGKNDGDRLYHGAWRRFAADISMEYDALTNVGNGLVSCLRDSIDRLAGDFIAQYGFIPEIARIVETIKRRTTFLLQEWEK